MQFEEFLNHMKSVLGLSQIKKALTETVRFYYYQGDLKDQMGDLKAVVKCQHNQPISLDSLPVLHS